METGGGRAHMSSRRVVPSGSLAASKPPSPWNPPFVLHDASICATALHKSGAMQQRTAYTCHPVHP
eukprot:3802908-Amphidinium_carterae.1